jgi:outer membrane protein assembly factor BamE (lipoprotein component of BamABCDE complex)
MPSERRATRTLRRAVALSACLAALCGCLIVPTPEHGLISGKGAVEPDTLGEFQVGHSTRADVLLRLGEPSQRRGNDRVFVYSWEVARGWWFVGAGYSGTGGPIPKQKYAAIRFDDAGVADDVRFVDPSWFQRASKELDEWAGPDAPEPPPPPVKPRGGAR